MQRDIRMLPAFQEVTEFYEGIFLPGQGHVSSVAEVIASSDGHSAFLTGRCFETVLGEGPSTRLFEVDLGRAEEVRLICGSGARMPRPSPDGAYLAFVRAAAGGRGDELLLRPLRNGGADRTICVEGLIEQVRWRNDARALLILAAGLGADIAGYQGGYAMTRSKEEGPDWLPEVRTGQEEDLWRRLWLYDLEQETFRPISAADANVWEASWCGAGVVAIRSLSHSEASWYTAVLVLIDPASGEERLIYQPIDQLGLPEGSPSGELVAFVEAVCSDRGLVCGTLWVIDLTSGEARRIDTEEVDVTSVAWSAEGRIHFAGQRAFTTVVGEVDPRSSELQVIWSSDAFTCGEWYPSAQPLKGRRSLVMIEAYDHPPSLGIASAGRLDVVRTFASEGAKTAAAEAPPMRPVFWTAPDGLEIHGWLLEP